MRKFTNEVKDVFEVLCGYPKKIKILNGRESYWYEDAEGVLFDIESLKIKYQSVPEVTVKLDGYLGENCKRALIDSDGDFEIIW